MHSARDSVDTGALQGARRATEDAPVSTRPLSPSIDSEVVAVAKRRRFTNADKRRIVLAAAACTKPGEIGALMRREGAYSSSLATWRRQYAAGELTGTDSKRRGPKADPAREELKQLALVTRERDKLRVQLSNAQLVIEVQKKVAALLEQLEPSRKFASP
ncbi:MAG: transposase [Burkholderiales bacterium RIFCSPHIGHO2_12_FULL_61_11]|nr:MAG: transposase [Burkholderiales bacterium RIFCSPHIGHO2_12_FULL_61_11]